MPLTSGNPISECKPLATLKVDLSKVPKSDFEIVSSNNGDYYKISYHVEMRFEAAISFRLLFKGRHTPTSSNCISMCT